jgi:hypothetical protein
MTVLDKVHGKVGVTMVIVGFFLLGAVFELISAEEGGV